MQQLKLTFENAEIINRIRYSYGINANKALMLVRHIQANPDKLTFREACTDCGIPDGGYRYLINTGVIEYGRKAKIVGKQAFVTVRLGAAGQAKLDFFQNAAAMPAMRR